MNRSKKLYMKAIGYYNDGYIDKAMEFCEKCISENINNTSAINLKGLLFYLKGELENAQALWKMNYQMNRDSVSKKYLEDSKKDEEKKELYNIALKYIKEINIKEALDMLLMCKQSDFNSLNVNNYITLCYMKLGEYLKAEKVIEEILRIDRLNKVALNNKKELIEFGVLKKDNNIKIYIAFTLAAVFAIMIFVFRDNLINHIIDSRKGEKTVVESKDVTSNNDKNVNDKKELISSSTENSFSSENLTRSIEESDYEGIYNIISKVEVKGLTEAENNLIAKAKEQLLQKGIEYFYNKGREAYSNKNYRESMKSFIKAYEFGEESYLYSHITFMLGATYESLNDINNTIKYYTEYDVKYPNGDYEQTVLYELTLIYKNIDNNKCKGYAEKLVRLYPKSIYNNTTIKGILLR